jgi:hypothetical protein
MDAFMRFPVERQRLFFQEAQQRIGLAPTSIEKDFWVCLTLRGLFTLPRWKECLTFKGGTSLSKCWGLISRFSEDLDIVINRESLGFGGDILSRKNQKRLMKECSRCVQEELRPVLQKHLQEILPGSLRWTLEVAGDDEDPDQQTLLLQYESLFEKGMTYLRPVVKIELGARSETEPVESPVVRPYLADAFPDLLGNSSFPLRAVAAQRTFWEKAMLLHEETFRPAEKNRKARLSRHYYDLFCLIRKGIAAQAISNMDLFDKVSRHRQVFFRQSWVDYETLRKGSLRVLPLPEQLGDWRRDYESMRVEMFFDEPPLFDEMLAVIRQFEEDFNRS